NPKSKIQNVIPRTFSLARLLLAVTAFCLLCGLAVNYPDQSLAYALLFAQLVPTGIVCLVLVSFARKRKTVLACSMLGGLVIGTFWMPAVQGPLRADPTRLWTY